VLEGENKRKLPLAFDVPLLRWTFENLADDLSPGWLSKPRETLLEAFEASHDITLIVQLPPGNDVTCSIELEGTEQRHEARVRCGEARFPLSKFIDSLRSLMKPLAAFCFSFVDQSGETQRIHTLYVRTRWVVDGLECRDTRIVSFRWQDKGRFKNRKLRLWSLQRLWEPPREYDIPDGANEFEIREDSSSLPAGTYRVELIMEGEYETSLPVFIPAANGADVFDIEIGNLQREDFSFSAPPFSFRRYLINRLLGSDERIDLFDYEITERDGDDLVRSLAFLIGEGREAEARRIWFDELRCQIRLDGVRKLMRERISMIADGGDDKLKRLLRNVCKQIALIAPCIIPFPPGSRISLRNDVYVYKAIDYWRPSSAEPRDRLYFVRSESTNPTMLELSDLDDNDSHRQSFE
jgi:hypothetical protein